MFLEVKDLQKVYGKGSGQTIALRQIDLTVKKGEFVAIMGESGSGKSTLLNIIATLDHPTHGKVLLNGRDITQLKEKEVAAFRREKLGFVFQDFNVLNTFNNRDNILLPLVLSNVSLREMDKRLSQLAPSLGIKQFLDKYPFEISGGQKQRIAIARALITQPEIILADEPTGALDSHTSDQIMTLFQQINAQGNTLLMVTHSVRSAAYSQRVLFIKDGVLYNELYRGEDSNRNYQERIANALSLLNKGGA
ncbi:ABC transporter ATP-binding protein [Aerococcus christensenii]